MVHRAHLEAVSWQENHFVVGREMQYPMKRRGFWMMVFYAIGWNHLRAKCWGYFFGLLWSDRGENQLKWYNWEGLKLTTKTPTLTTVEEVQNEGSCFQNQFSPNVPKTWRFLPTFDLWSCSSFSRDFLIFVVWRNYNLQWPPSSGWVGELPQNNKTALNSSGWTILQFTEIITILKTNISPENWW